MARWSRVELRSGGSQDFQSYCTKTFPSRQGEGSQDFQSSCTKTFLSRQVRADFPSSSLHDISSAGDASGPA
jgi:hypothetical protein